VPIEHCARPRGRVVAATYVPQVGARRLHIPEETTEMATTYYGYERLIHEDVPDLDPALVEAWMRIRNPTLDNIDRDWFREEALIAADAIRQVGVEEAARLCPPFNPGG
jgi:hypothetical protein